MTENCKTCAKRIWQNGYFYCGLTADEKKQDDSCDNYKKEEK